jgi:heptosyltransferase-3
VSNHGSETARRSSALVVFPGALGDFVCLLPALESIRRSGCERIVLVCKSDLHSLIEAAGLAEPMAIEGRQASAIFQAAPPREAQEFFRRFDRIESFSGSGVAEVESNLRRFSGSRARVHAFRPPPREHLAAYFLRCVSGEARLGEQRGRSVVLPPRALEAARARVASLGRPLLVLHPGSGGRRKRWSRNGFAAIATRWSQRGSALVLLGPAEAEEAHAWRRVASSVVADVDLLAVASLLAVADRYLGNDSGVSHLAGAVGARGVALFGPTDPAEWRPLSPRITALSLQPWTECDEDASNDAIDRALGALESAGSAS